MLPVGGIRSRRRENWPIDGELQSGWFAHDFTLAEIKTLGVVATDPERRSSTTASSGS